MDISTTLSVDLAKLLKVVGLGEIDLDAAVRALHLGIAGVVPTFVGFALTVTMERQPVTLTSMTEETLAAPIGSSLALPLAPGPDVRVGTVLVLYATAPSAFAALAADLAHPVGAGDDALVLDEHLEPTLRSGLTGVEEMSMVNRAVGLLLGRGLTPEAARASLQRRATQANLQVTQVAAHLVSMTE